MSGPPGWCGTLRARAAGGAIIPSSLVITHAGQLRRRPRERRRARRAHVPAGDVVHLAAHNDPRVGRRRVLRHIGQAVLAQRLAGRRAEGRQTRLLLRRRRAVPRTRRHGYRGWEDRRDSSPRPPVFAAERPPARACSDGKRPGNACRCCEEVRERCAALPAGRGAASPMAPNEQQVMEQVKAELANAYLQARPLLRITPAAFRASEAPDAAHGARRTAHGARAALTERRRRRRARRSSLRRARERCPTPLPPCHLQELPSPLLPAAPTRVVCPTTSARRDAGDEPQRPCARSRCATSASTSA